MIVSAEAFVSIHAYIYMCTKAQLILNRPLLQIVLYVILKPCNSINEMYNLIENDTRSNGKAHETYG